MSLPSGIINTGAQHLIGAGELFTTGKVFYVDSVTGSDGNVGSDPAAPKATVDSAIGSCTANKGDTIVLMPGHAETVTATSIALDVAGVTILGLGNGLKRPTFTFGAAAATITVSAANCAWKGCHFIGNFLDVAAAFTLAAAKDFELNNNSFIDNTASLGFLSIIVTNATDNSADGLTVTENYVYGLDLSPNAVISILAAQDRVLIADNHANLAATNDVGHFITVAAKIVKGIRILRNSLIVVGSSGATVGIFMTGSSTTNTGIVAYNLVNSLDAGTELITTAALGLAMFDNKYTGALTASGYILPAIDA